MSRFSNRPSSKSATGGDRFIYRNFAGGTPETGGDHGA